MAAPTCKGTPKDKDRPSGFGYWHIEPENNKSAITYQELMKKMAQNYKQIEKSEGWQSPWFHVRDIRSLNLPLALSYDGDPYSTQRNERRKSVPRELVTSVSEEIVIVDEKGMHTSLLTLPGTKVRLFGDNPSLLLPFDLTIEQVREHVRLHLLSAREDIRYAEKGEKPGEELLRRAAEPQGIELISENGASKYIIIPSGTRVLLRR